MIVRCLATRTLAAERAYRDLTVGREYVVLTVEFYASWSRYSASIGDFVVYRVRDDERLVTPFPASLFEIADGRMPASWVISRLTENSYDLTPRSWAFAGFWELYYDDDPAALAAFDREERLMLQLASG